MARIRTFIGIDIGDDIRAKAVALQERLSRTGAKVKWVESHNLHVSLIFLGEIDDRDLVAVCRAVEDAAGREAPFALRLGGVGAFPTPRRPKILWAGISEGIEPLRRLHRGLETRLLDLGVYRKEERGYTPHLTLGRVKSDSDGFPLAQELPKLLTWDGGQTAVHQVLFFSSELGKDGPEYTVLARGELGGRNK